MGAKLMDFRVIAGYPPRPMPRSRRAPQVHKFGGASLADSAAVRHAVDIIRRHRPEPTVVVVSAMAGTTDALLGVAQQAGAGESRTVASLIARLRSRHAEVARALLPSGRARSRPPGVHRRRVRGAGVAGRRGSGCCAS